MNICLKSGDYWKEEQNLFHRTSQWAGISGYFYGYLSFMWAHKKFFIAGFVFIYCKSMYSYQSFSNMDMLCFCFGGWNSPLVSGFRFKASKLQIKTEVPSKVLGTSLTDSYNLTNQHPRNFMHFQGRSMILVGVPIVLFLPLQILVFLYAFCSQETLYYLISIYRQFIIFLFMPQATVCSVASVSQ